MFYCGYMDIVFYQCCGQYGFINIFGVGVDFDYWVQIGFVENDF